MAEEKSNWGLFKKPLSITLAIIVSSFLILWLYKGNYDFFDWAFMNSNEKLLRGAEVSTEDDRKITLAEKTVALSDIRRNYALLFFAIVAGGFAIWARYNHEKQLKRIKEQMAQTEKQLENAEVQIKQTEKQLKHAKTQEKQTEKQLEHVETQIKQTNKQLINTQKQIKNSLIVNRNDRFAKASDMLGIDKPLTSQGGGLYMLRDLIADSPKTEYIRCAEVIGYWLREQQDESSLQLLALEIFTGEAIKNLSSKIRRSLIAKHKKEHNRHLWPDIKDANLSNLSFSVAIDLQSAILVRVNLSRSNLKKANLRNSIMALVSMEGTELEDADFSGAFIAGAKMKTAKGLTKEQILSATWQNRHGKGEPPELPDELMQDLEVQKWLENPLFRYRL